MSPSNDLEEAISNIEEAIKHHQCPESIRADVKILIEYARESLKSLDAPNDESLMSELHRVAAIYGMQVNKMTLAEKAYKLAEILEKREIKKRSAQRSGKRRRR